MFPTTARVADDLPCRDLSHCTEFYIAVGVFTFYIGLYIGLYIVNFTFTVNFHVNVNVKPFGDFTCKSRTLRRTPRGDRDGARGPCQAQI